MNTDCQWSKQEECFASANKMWLAIYEFDVRSVLHRKVSLSAVNHIYVIHEVMNGSKKSLYISKGFEEAACHVDRFHKKLSIYLSVSLYNPNPLPSIIGMFTYAWCVSKKD